MFHPKGRRSQADDLEVPLMVMWLLLSWCLLSVPFSVLVGRAIAAADSTRAAGSAKPRAPRDAPHEGGDTAPALPVLVPAGWR